jgi:hypothetical protein
MVRGLRRLTERKYVVVKSCPILNAEHGHMSMGDNEYCDASGRWKKDMWEPKEMKEPPK